jgi:hypothetical protein
VFEIEREKRVASVHRRKRERYLTFVPVHGKGERESEKAKHKSAVVWEALRKEDHTPLDLLVTDKEEVCTRPAQLPCTGIRDTKELLTGMLESLRVKYRAHRRQERVVRDSLRSKQKGRGDGS